MSACMSETSFRHRFVADATLGQLAKHLRLAGFDTLLDTQVPRPDRLASLARDQRTILTRSGKVHRVLTGIPLILVRANDPRDQFRQVTTTLDLGPGDLRPLTLCARCNRELDRLSKSDALGRVPEYVWQRHDDFKTCAECRRIYWPGSHAQRWREQIIHWFSATK